MRNSKQVYTFDGTEELSECSDAINNLLLHFQKNRITGVPRDSKDWYVEELVVNTELAEYRDSCGTVSEQIIHSRSKTYSIVTRCRSFSAKVVKNGADLFVVTELAAKMGGQQIPVITTPKQGKEYRHVSETRIKGTAVSEAKPDSSKIEPTWGSF